jgi:hypothetical protein
MSITTYNCSACKRSIEIVDNDNALTFVDRCVITQFCKGTLSKVNTKSGSLVSNATDLVDGLQDYIKTDRMYSYTQTLPSSSWKITHDLNSNPLTYVYIKSINNTYTPIDDDNYVVTVLDSNNVIIEFADSIVGIAHLISRGNAEQKIIADQQQTVQGSANGILTIATPVIVNDQLSISYNITSISPVSNTPSTHSVSFLAHKYQNSISLFNTPWKDAQLITWNNSLYRVRSVRISNVLSSGDIQDRSPFYFTDNPDILILLSNSPYTDPVDINKSVYVVQQPTLVYNQFLQGEVVVQQSSVVDSFPGIIVHKTIYQ